MLRYLYNVGPRGDRWISNLLDEIMTQRPTSVLGLLGAEKTACTPRGEIRSARYNPTYSTVVGNYTIQPLPQVTFFEPDRPDSVEADAVKHERRGRAG
jgi:hypothetical protein